MHWRSATVFCVFQKLLERCTLSDGTDVLEHVIPILARMPQLQQAHIFFPLVRHRSMHMHLALLAMIVQCVCTICVRTMAILPRPRMMLTSPYALSPSTSLKSVTNSCGFLSFWPIILVLFAVYPLLYRASRRRCRSRQRRSPLLPQTPMDRPPQEAVDSRKHMLQRP